MYNFSQFGYYNINETVVNFTKRNIYKQDLIGLKSLDDKGKLKVITVPGINHYMWHLNVTIMQDYILPYLD